LLGRVVEGSYDTFSSMSDWDAEEGQGGRSVKSLMKDSRRLLGIRNVGLQRVESHCWYASIRRKHAINTLSGKTLTRGVSIISA